MQPEPDFLRVFEVSEGKNTKRWRSYPVPPFAGEAPHVLSSFVARQQYAGLELVRGSLPGEEDESGSCDWVSKQVWQVAERLSIMWKAAPTHRFLTVIALHRRAGAGL